MSLLLCAATGALWCGSYSKDPNTGNLRFVWSHDFRATEWRVYLDDGSANIEFDETVYRPFHTGSNRVLPGLQYRVMTDTVFMNWSPGEQILKMQLVSVQFWLILSVLAVLFTAFVLPTLWRILKRSPRVCPPCLNCSYNLTGNTSGTCPECGTPLPSKVQAIP
jgi:hypothetical protein